MDDTSVENHGEQQEHTHGRGQIPSQEEITRRLADVENWPDPDAFAERIIRANRGLFEKLSKM